MVLLSSEYEIKTQIIELINKLEVDENGLITNKSFAKEIYAKRNVLQKLPLCDSYLPKTEWYSLSIGEDAININSEDESDYEIVMVRISNLTQPLKKYKELIQNEFKLNVELQLLDYGITPKFKGYSYFKTKVVSIFYTQTHSTVAKHVKNDNLRDIILELIDKLYLIHPHNDQCFLTPTLSPNNILWSHNDLYTIIFTEIFLSIDSDDKLIKLEILPTSKWFVQDFSQMNNSEQCTLSYYSSIHSFGYVLYYLLTGLEPPKSEEEWKNILNDDSNNIFSRNNNFFRNILKKCINASEEKPVSFSSLYSELNEADPSIFENIRDDIKNNSNDINANDLDKNIDSFKIINNIADTNSTTDTITYDTTKNDITTNNTTTNDITSNDTTINDTTTNDTTTNDTTTNDTTINDTIINDTTINDTTINDTNTTINDTDTTIDTTINDTNTTINDTNTTINDTNTIDTTINDTNTIDTTINDTNTIDTTNDINMNTNSNKSKINKEKNMRKNNNNNFHFTVPNDKYNDGFIYEGINENTTNVIYYVHIEIKLKKPIDFDIEVYDLYRPDSTGYKLLKYEFNNDDGTKYFSVVPFYLHNKMKSLVFGVRGCSNYNEEILLIEPKLTNIKNNIKGYKIILTNVKPDMNINVYKPIYENELNYLKQISLINPKNYEYSYQHLSELTDLLSNRDLVDIVLKTGFNPFTEVIISILGSRNYLLNDISNYIDNNYKISSNEYKNAPKLIHKLIQKTGKNTESKQENWENQQIVIGKKRSEFLCDSGFLYSSEDKINGKSIINDTINNMDVNNNNFLEYIDRDYCKKKIEEYNNSEEGQNRKLNLIPTDETVNKIRRISVGIKRNIPIIIQGFTSAGKSFNSIMSCIINRNQYPITTALSENTTVEDLLEKFVLQRKNSSMMSFVPGILLTAYTEGRILILDECDLAKPEVLSCILRSISKDEIVVNNTVYKKMKGYNVILTMNGEAEGFTKNQRNELPSNILSKFVIVKFDKMSKEECESIFKELISDIEGYEKHINNFVNLHEKMLDYKQKTVDPIVTLRNLKASIYLSKVNIPVRFSAEIAYTGRFPKDERNTFNDILNNFGSDEIDELIKKDISERFNEDNLYYNDSYLKCAYLALAACKAGLHPLLIGKNGSGLTELAKFIACNYTCNTDTFIRKTQREYVELIQLGSESSVDDLLGCFQPNINENVEENNKSDEGVDLTKIISWVDGPIIRAGKKGNPVILDRIDCAKSQVIECLNPLLEDNSVFNNVQFKLIEKDNKEQIDIGKGFVIISTMVIEEGKEMMSKALMNRFVAIYLDDFTLNSETIEKITKITIKNLNNKLEYNINSDNKFVNNNNSYCYRFGNKLFINENEQNNLLEERNEENEENKENEEEEEEGEGINIFDSSDESEENNYTSSEYQIDDNDDDEFQKKIPNWYDINILDDENICNITNKIKNMKFNNIKSLVKTVSKLCYVIQRTQMDVSDSYNLLKLDESIYDLKEKNNLISKMLNEDTSDDNKFFFKNENKGNSIKMILSLISCDLSNSPIFIQDSPGSGKSVAARHYGSFRKFRSRDPILSISCNSDMSFDQFVGTFSFKNTSFQFVEGPLLTAIKNGEPILIDEFNLCSEEVLLNLLPLLKAEVNDYVKLKGVPYQVQIKPGFLFIATGNDDNESGRKRMPQLILDELTIVKISNPSLNEYKALLDVIIKNEYQDCNKYITPDNICDIVQIMESIAQQSFSLRQIKSLLKRIDRFCTGELIDNEISNEEYKKIPVAYVIISFIIPGLKIGPERVEQMIRRIGEIFKTDSNELLEFIKSDVTIVSRGKDNYFIKKGKLILKTSLKRRAYPPTMLQTYFWIRMSCSLNSDTPSIESLLLEGPTSYKSHLLELWLTSSTGKDSYEEHFVTKNTETQDLIGLSTLDDKEKLSNLIDFLIDKAIKHLSEKKESIKGERKDKFKLIKDELESDNGNNIGLEYIYRCVKELIKLEESYDKSQGIKTMTSFSLGIVSSACIFGQKLIMKGIDQISPSVIERINSVLEYPRSLVLTEDTQGIFNNKNIFSNLYKSNRRSIPISDYFAIYFTSREVFNGRLSEAFKSRCTIINCPSYDNKLYLGIKLNTFENYRSIAESIITKDVKLQKEIIELYDRISKKYRIPVLSFIRWCKTTERISKSLKNTNIKYIVGISVLRSIFDGYEPNIRNEVIKELLFDYLPEDLYNVLVNKSHNVVCETPFIIEKNKNDLYVKSLYSKIQLKVFNPDMEKLKEIRWTKSAVDMADSILTSLAAHTMLIFEGPPGRGKTAIAMTIYEALGIDYRRINLSPSTTEEDIFERTVPIVDKDDNIKTENLKGPLYQVLNNSSTSIKYCRNGLLLDEINLASNELLDQLYSFLTSLFYKKVYHTPQGEDYEIGNIGVIAKLSNARTTLSSTILNLSHTFKLPNYEPEEMKILAENILGSENLFKKKENLIRAITCFFNSQKYTKNRSETGGVTLREILKLKEFTNKCPDVPLDTLLDLVLCANMSDENISKFKNENQFNNTLSNITPEIKNNTLCFEDLIKYDLVKPRYDGPLNKQFTLSEKDALMKILIGLTAERTILLSGDIGTGKTHIIESLADIIGVKLNVIQFNTETSSSDTIGRLEMSVDSNEVSKIKYELNKLMHILINDEWPRVTSFIKFINEESLNSGSINEFFEKLFEKDPLNQEALEQLDLCKNQLKHFSTLSCTSFEFKKSLLINAMENGEWVLLDDVNYAPQEIERLMSLLEENSSLTIYEQNPPVIYSRDIIEDTDFIKHKQIHKDFRLFVITSNESVLSAAIKSRCLCVKLKPFAEAQHYAELISSCLIDSYIPEDCIITIATHVGNAFYNIKKHEKENDYILKNYLLTPVNLVNLSKCLTNNNGKILSESINFNIFSMFKDKKEQYDRFKSSLSSEVDFNITTINKIMKNKMYIIGMIERKIIEYAYSLSKKKNKIKSINELLNNLFYNLYQTKRMTKIEIINNENETTIINYIKNSKKILIENLESFTIGNVEEYKEYIEEVLHILEKLISEKEQIFSNLYYLKEFHSLLEELSSISNTKIKGLKLKTIENSKEFFLQFGDMNDDAEQNAKKLYWFRNAINGFDYIIPDDIKSIDLRLSIISIYYNYYFEEYNQLKSSDKEIISKDIYINLKMLENIELRNILKKFNFFKLDKNIKKIFYLLVHFDKPISVVMGESANEELTIEISRNIIVRFNENKYSLNNSKEIEKLKSILGLENIKNKYVKEISNKNYANEYIDYIFPKSLIRNNDLIGGYIYWFYKLFAQKQLNDTIINNGILCEFNDAIEYIVKIHIFDLKNTEGIWNNELKEILNKGYQLIYSLKNLKNIFWENSSNENKRKYINHFIENSMNIKKECKRFNACNSKLEIIEYIINLMEKIRNFFKNFEINIWENMNLFIDICTDFIEDEKLKKKFNEEKIEYARQLEILKNKIDDVCNTKNKYKFNPIYDEINKLKDQLNEKNNEEIEENIKKIEKKINMYRIANESNTYDTTDITNKKSQILSSTNNDVNNYKNEYSRILEKYSKLCDIVNKLKDVNKQQLFVNYMFRFSDISSLECFNEVYKHSLDDECLNGEYVSNYLIIELKHLVNSLLISDIINIYNEQRTNYVNYSDFITRLLNNDLDYIKSIGSYFRDDDYIYLPKFDVTDLKYCVRYGLEKKKNCSLTKIYIDSDKMIREPEENEKIEDYLKYLIFCCDSTLNYSGKIDNINEYIKESNKPQKLKDTINNLYNAYKLIKLFQIKYKYDYDWLMKDIDEMKDVYWKNPGKIIVKNEFNSLLQFENEKDIFDEDKIIAKSLYATHEADSFNAIKCNNEYLRNLLIEILGEIYNNTNNYKYGYRLISFYNKRIYKDNVAETMVTLIYSVFKSLDSSTKNILVLKNHHIKDIITKIIRNFIINCIENEFPNFDNNELMNIDKILITVLLTKYEIKYNEKINELESTINNDKDIFVLKNIEIITEVWKKLNEKQKQYETELNDYNKNIEILRNRYLEESSIKKYIKKFEKKFEKKFKGFFNIFKHKKDNSENTENGLNEKDNSENIENELNEKDNSENIENELDEKNIPEEIKEEYQKYVDKNIEEENLKSFYGYKKKKPFNEKYDEKLKLLDNLYDSLKKIRELSLSECNNIRNKLCNIEKEYTYIKKYTDDEYVNKYFNIKKELINKIDYYLQLTNKNNELKIIKFEKMDTQYNIEEDIDIEILVKWINELQRCNISMGILEYRETNNREIIKIEKVSNGYSSNTNWIFDKDNKPNFLLDNININLGIYILEHIHTNNIGSILFDNNCSYSIKYTLEQDNSNSILAYSTKNTLQHNESMNIKFRLNKKLKYNETIKCEFYIRLMSNNNEEIDKCRVYVYLNVIPLCLKFKLNEKYNIDENNNISINHYTKSLKIEHQYPGNYSSNNLGIRIKSNENNKYNKLKTEQEKGKIVTNFEISTQQLRCSKITNINLNKLNLLHLNLDFVTPTNYGLIIYDENNRNIQSIDITKGNSKIFYLFNMSTLPIKINYEYDKNKIKLTEEIKNINPGKREKLELQIISEIKSEKISINNKKIDIKLTEFPKLNIKSYENYYGYLYSQYIYCYCPNKSMQNKINYIIINNKYEYKFIKRLSNNANKIENLEDVSSCYLIYNNKIIDKIENDYKFAYFSIYSTVYGFSENEFMNNKKCNKVDVILKLNDTYYHGHIFKEKQMEIFSKILSNKEFKNNLESNDLNDIYKSIDKLIKIKFDINKTINENITNLEISEHKTSIINIIKYLLKLSMNKKANEFINDLKNYINIMYNRELLIPYFKVNNNLDEYTKEFMNKLSYIISFVDIVVKPGTLSEYTINYYNNINKNNNFNNEIHSENDDYMIENFNRCFKNGMEKDNENSELIYYNNKIYKHTNIDDFEIFNKQIKDTNIDNNNYDKEKIRNFIQTYNKEIQDTLNMIIKNKINISNLFNILDECIEIITKFPLIFSTIEEDTELSYCVSNCQKIYDFISNLIHSPIYKTEFSERINITYTNMKNILSKYKFFDIKTNGKNISESSDLKNNINIKSIIQCELPFDNNFENDIIKNNDNQEKTNKFADAYNKKNIRFDNSQYISGNNDNYKGELSNNKNINNKHEVIKPMYKAKHKSKYVTILTDKERAEISIPFLNDNIEQTENNKYNNENNTINDILDYENTNKEMKISMDILEAKLNKTTPKEFLEMVMEKTAYKNQTLSEIKLSKLKRKGLDKIETFNYYDECSQASSFIQSTLSNLIKSNVKIIDKNKILPNTIFDSYVDITVDITHMSEIQRITALVLSTGLSIPLSHYGVNIRISVFGERNGVWLLSEGFSKDVTIQLARLRDALASKKRFMSFPGDAVYSLKHDWKNRFYNEQTNYTSVLISSLISPQVVNKQNDWSNDISNNIVVFGLKSDFDEEFKNKYRIYEELLQIPISDKNQVKQEFLEPMNVLSQNESERGLLEKLCKSLVMSCIYNSDNDNFEEHKIIVNNDNNNTVNEMIPMENIFKFINDNMEDKIFFGQNIPHIMTDISKLNKMYNPPKILLPSMNDLLQDIYANNNGTIGNLKITVESILKTQFGLAFAPNSSSGKVPSSSGGTISIPAIKKWIVSGFTYKDIFLKKAGKTQRKYSVTIAIDLSSSVLLSCNYSHAIATILLILLAPSTLQDNEELKIDVIISTINGPKIMFMSSKANTFESISCINSIINVINNETSNYCTPGNTLNAAYQIQLQKGGVGIGKNIFFITDSYVTSRKEIMFANSIINSCENAGIDLITIGVGSYPCGIKQLYPKCCYAPSLRVLGDAIAFLFAISRDPTSKEIIPQVIIDSTTNEIQNRLNEMIKEPPDNKELQKSIENKKMNYIEMMGNNNTMTLENNMSLLDKNPEIEPYYDGLFNGFKILIVILYLGGYEYNGKIRDQDITIQQFESGAGRALKRKGFNYKLVFSYGDAINELTKSEAGRCPYIETWIFCSRADGSLPDVAEDKDSNKIIPFFKCIAEYNNNGGGLLLFCDNEPFTLETNILLSEFLNFEDENGFKVKPKFIMKGNYNQPDINK